MLPAPAGVVPEPARQLDRARRAPRACGGGPTVRLAMLSAPVCSPRLRGWSFWRQHGCQAAAVLPAPAGVVPPRRPASASRRSAPRACGGGPAPGAVRPARGMCSPRLRGWSPDWPSSSRSCRVLPAPARMVPTPARCSTAAPVPVSAAIRLAADTPVWKGSIGGHRPRRSWRLGFVVRRCAVPHPCPPERSALVNSGAIGASPGCRRETVCTGQGRFAHWRAGDSQAQSASSILVARSHPNPRSPTWGLFVAQTPPPPPCPPRAHLHAFAQSREVRTSQPARVASRWCCTGSYRP